MSNKKKYICPSCQNKVIAQMEGDNAFPNEILKCLTPSCTSAMYVDGCRVDPELEATIELYQPATVSEEVVFALYTPELGYSKERREEMMHHIAYTLRCVRDYVANGGYLLRQTYRVKHAEFKLEY